jgi:SpoVK/Ycf46/Vps4 family AAA+-type ATPase
MLTWVNRLHTSRMSLSEDVDLEEFVTTKDDLSGADIKAVCTEAGLLALRERRMRVTKQDFTTARERVSDRAVVSSAKRGLLTFCVFVIDTVPEERGRTRGSVPMKSCNIIVVHSTSTMCDSLGLEDV